MTEIVASRDFIHQESVDKDSPLSEDLGKRMGASINWILSNSVSQLGDVTSSVLSVADFQSLRGNNWVLMDGSDISGSDLAALTGNTTLPNMMNYGALVQSDSDANLESLHSGSIKSHRHRGGVTAFNVSGGDTTRANTWDTGTASNSITYQDTDGFGNPIIENTGGTYNEAAGVKVNFFIKINNEPT